MLFFTFQTEKKQCNLIVTNTKLFAEKKNQQPIVGCLWNQKQQFNPIETLTLIHCAIFHRLRFDTCLLIELVWRLNDEHENNWLLIESVWYVCYESSAISNRENPLDCEHVQFVRHYKFHHLSIHHITNIIIILLSIHFAIYHCTSYALTARVVA